MNTNIKIFILFASVFLLFSFSGAECNVVQQATDGKPGAELKKENVNKAVTAVANFLAGLSGTVAMIFLIMGGIQYISSAGNQEQSNKAKQTITNAIIGLILIVCSYAIVYWFMNFVSKGEIGF